VKTILHLIETGGPGGAETVYLNLIRRLQPTRWRSIAVVPMRGWVHDQLVASGVEPHLVPERHSLDLRFFRRLAGLIKGYDVDLIHAHLFGSAVRAALLSEVLRVPAIATLHGGIDVGAAERFRSAKVALLNHGLERVVFVSEALRRSFLETVPLRGELTMVIPNGIDASRFTGGDGSAFRLELGIRADDFVVGAVGSPGRHAKGLDILLEVAAILKTRSPGIRVVLVGDLEGGRGNDILAQRAALGLARDVIVTGFRADVDRALAAFDVYALTSRSEGFSLSLVEAMAAGLPVVSTRCGGPELILNDGHIGILVENGSAQAVASAIIGLRADVNRRRSLGAAAREEVRRRFTLDAQINAYEALYEEVLS
jgi:glycosyltransferase involved in cell wall biosynthesis